MTRLLTAALMTTAIVWLVGETVSDRASAQDQTYPHVVQCTVKGVRYFAYLDRVAADGGAVYSTPSGDAVAVPAGGVVRRQGAVQGDCSGKTLEQLVASGQARFLWD